MFKIVDNPIKKSPKEKNKNYNMSSSIIYIRLI